MAIDYGKKRAGIAVTDPLGIIANKLAAIPANEIWSFLSSYLEKEKVSRFVVGYPLKMNNTPSEAVIYINPFIKKLKKTYPDIPVEQIDERFSSKLAQKAMLEGGLKKKDRQNKELVDSISATILLQSYLERKKFES